MDTMETEAMARRALRGVLEKHGVRVRETEGSIEIEEGGHVLNCGVPVLKTIDEYAIALLTVETEMEASEGQRRLITWQGVGRTTEEALTCAAETWVKGVFELLRLAETDDPAHPDRYTYAFALTDTATGESTPFWIYKGPLEGDHEGMDTLERHLAENPIIKHLADGLAGAIVGRRPHLVGVILMRDEEGELAVGCEVDGQTDLVSTQTLMDEFVWPTEPRPGFFRRLLGRVGKESRAFRQYFLLVPAEGAGNENMRLAADLGREVARKEREMWAAR